VTIKVKYDVETLQHMRYFETVTRARLKDMIVHGEKVFFVVEKGNLRKALGENKINVTKLEDHFKKKVKIIEYTEDELKFIVNVFAPLKVLEIKNEENIVTVTGPDQKTKGLMIGARAQNLRLFEGIVQKYFPHIKELKVI